MEFPTTTKIDGIKYNKIESVNYDSAKEEYYVEIGDDYIAEKDFGNFMFPGVEGKNQKEIKIKNTLYKTLDRNLCDTLGCEFSSMPDEDVKEIINNVYSDTQGVLNTGVKTEIDNKDYFHIINSKLPEWKASEKKNIDSGNKTTESYCSGIQDGINMCLNILGLSGDLKDDWGI